MQIKHLFYTLMATAGLLLSTACSNDDELSRGNGGEAAVSFSVELSGGMQTKAISDGTTAKNLTVHVFDANGDYLSSLDKTATFDDQLKATVTINLVKGKTYNFLFWAAAEGSPYTIDADGKTINVSYDNATANDEKRDAFLAVVENKKVEASFEESVTLKRPFAQLNFLTDDIDKAAAAGLQITETTQSAITISNAAATLNPFTKTVSGQQEVTFAAAAIPAASETYTINNTPYRYLGTTYFLVDAAGTAVGDGTKQATLTSTSLQIDGVQGDGLTVTNVPAQWNYRTNIYGSLLTATGDFNVTIDPDYGKPDHDKPQSVTVDQVGEAIKNGATEVIVTEVPTEEATISIPKVFESGNNTKISLTIPQSDQKITIQYDEQTEAAPKEVVITAPTTAELVINLPNSTVTLNEGTYTSVTATTAANTLIIPEGVEVGTLTVNKGNVEIYGHVASVSLAENYNDKVTTYAVFNTNDLNNAIKVKAETIVFKSDIDITSAVVNISHNTKFQLLEGVTVKTARQSTGANIVVDNNCKLTIEGNGIISGDNRLIDVNGDLVINGGKYRTSTKNRGSIITVNPTAHVEINDCDMIAANCVLWIEGKTVVNGGKMVSTNSSQDPEVGTGWSYALRVINESGSLTINGGEVEGIQGAVGMKAGEIIINGGYFHTHPKFSSNDNFYALYCSDGVGETVVNGGKFYAEGKYDVYITNTGKVELRGGKFEDKGFMATTNGEITLPDGYEWNSTTDNIFKFEVKKSETK